MYKQRQDDYTVQQDPVQKVPSSNDMKRGVSRAKGTDAGDSASKDLKGG